MGPDLNSPELDLKNEELSMRRAAKLHSMHWLVVGLSLLITCFAWYISKKQVEEKVEAEFDRQASNIIELVKERLQKYEDGLWGGVAAINLNNQKVDHRQWEAFAKSLEIEKKYPGINGIGVIFQVDRKKLPQFLTTQKKSRPNFKVYPDHNEEHLLPITYIEPVAINRKAVGLDIAHEINRFEAAKKARDKGKAKITGPIVLVQDSGQTAGFLFYAPFYKPNSKNETLEQRRDSFLGLVYAPFVVNKLVAGTLQKEKRKIDFRITDGNEVIYDELNDTFPEYDPKPLFKRTVDLQLYGRTWHFDLWSSLSFRNTASSNQPLIILLGGISIDILLLIIFVILSRSNQRAIVFADKMTKELKLKKADLERSNIELEQFAFVASHDLQAPIRHISAYADFLKEEFQTTPTSTDAKSYLSTIINSSQKMRTLVDDLLAFSRLGQQDLKIEVFNLSDVVQEAEIFFSAEIKSQNFSIVLKSDVKMRADLGKINQLIQNLLSNSIKYKKPDLDLKIEISAEEKEDHWQIDFSDNGIGIAPEFREKVFKVFQRLHGDETFKGTGIGLAICKKIVEIHQGKIWIQSNSMDGTTFSFTIHKPG